jgi:hypothetical protein
LGAGQANAFAAAGDQDMFIGEMQILECP